MGNIEKSKFKKLNLPEHYDPSMEKMRENMEIVDNLLHRAVPEGVCFDSIDGVVYDIDSIKDTGIYIINYDASPLFVPSFARVYSCLAMSSEPDSRYVIQEVYSLVGISTARIRNGYFYNDPDTGEVRGYWGDWYSTGWNSLYSGSGSNIDADSVDGFHADKLLKTYDKSNEPATYFNNLTEAGIYHFNSIGDDAPEWGMGLWTCIVLPTDPSYTYKKNCLIQLAFIDGASGADYMYGHAYFRKKNGANNWGSWQRLLMSDDLPNLLSHRDMGFDYIVKSYEDWLFLTSDAFWHNLQRVGIAGNFSDITKGKITVPDNIKLICGVPQFSGFTTNPTGMTPSITLNSIQGHSDCTIRGLHILLDARGETSGGNLSTPVNLMSDFGVVENCRIELGNSNSLSATSPESDNRIRGLYNCQKVLHTYITDVNVPPPTYDGYKNITYVSECGHLTDVTVYSFEEKLPRSSLCGFYKCTTLTGCVFIYKADMPDAQFHSGYYKCSILTDCSVVLKSNSPFFADGLSNNTVVSECELINGLILDSEVATPDVYSVRIIDCPNLISYINKSSHITPNILSCRTPYIPIIKGGTSSSPLSIGDLWINGSATLPYIVRGGYLKIDSPARPLVSETLNANQPILVLSYGVDPNTNTDFMGDIVIMGGMEAEFKHFFIPSSGSDSVVWSSPIYNDVISEGNLNLNSREGFLQKIPHYDVYDFNDATDIGIHSGTASANTPDSTDEDMSNWTCITLSTNMYSDGYLTQLAFKDMESSYAQMYIRRQNGTAGWTSWSKVWNSNNDGSGSGLNADLLDGKHAYQMVRYGDESGSFLTTGDPKASSTGCSQMYRFKDSSNLIGEGANRYYGIIQIYYSSSYYIRIAVSMTSGKVYRQTSSQTAWNEITPTIPVLSEDPPYPSEGQMWIVSQ